MLGQRPLQRQRGALGERGNVLNAHPRGEVIGQPMRLVVGARDDDERCRRRKRRPPRREMGRARAGRHAKDARWRQMRHQGVDERGDAAVPAAGRSHRCVAHGTGVPEPAGRGQPPASSAPLKRFMAVARPSLQPSRGRVGTNVDHLVGELALVAGKRRQDVAAEAAPASPDTDSEARDGVRAERGDDVAHPVVAAGRPVGAQADAAEVEVGIVVDDEEL